MIYNWFKINRPPTLPHARQAAAQARANHGTRMNEILGDIAAQIAEAVSHGEHGITYEHYHSRDVTEELTKRLKTQGYIVTPSPDGGTYIAWLPVMADT